MPKFMRMNFSPLDALNERVNLSEQKGVNLSERYSLYELASRGEVSSRLIEQINTRFCRSKTLRNLVGDTGTASFITLIYGEISNSGRFRFVSAGHPPPLVFSRE
jgi:hypothetical protein